MNTRTQRWRDRLNLFRPGEEPIRTAEYEVTTLDWRATHDFICRHHYSGSLASSRFRFGLFRHNQLVGAANFGVSPRKGVIAQALGIENDLDGVDLNRFVLLDSVAGNGETWFLARCFHLLRKHGLAGVLSYSDPARRMNGSGQVVFRGHLGIIYQAHNAVYLGRATARTLKILPDGRVFSEKKLSKIRTADQGVDYSVRDLVRWGADEPARKEPVYLRTWLRLWTSRICRNARHRGNHKYVWSLSRKLRLPKSMPYPKVLDHECSIVTQLDPASFGASHVR